MVWTSLSPDGTKSVRTNVPVMAANTTYTETTLNVDHYWNIGVDEDGHHKQVQMPKQASDITLGTGMDGGTYLKETSYGRIEGFFRNTNGVYQYIPSFITGSIALLTSTYIAVVAIPNNTYGTIHMFKNNGADNSQFGWFNASSGIVRAYSNVTQKTGSSSRSMNVQFNNDGAGALIFKALAVSGGAGTYQFRITLWDI